MTTSMDDNASMSLAEVQVRRDAAKKDLERWQRVLDKKACDSCIHWTGHGCKASGGAVPPAEVQRTGCQAWRYDLIPF
jgi:hypothetical protein